MFDPNASLLWFLAGAMLGVVFADLFGSVLVGWYLFAALLTLFTVDIVAASFVR